MSVLTEAEIQAAVRDGQIFINPFNKNNLNSSSCNLTLGKYYYRVNQPPEKGIIIHNPYSFSDGVRGGKTYQGYYEANTIEQLGQFGLSWREEDCSIKHDDLGILLRPNETILCHTAEFVGSKAPYSSLAVGYAPLSNSLISITPMWNDMNSVKRMPIRITNDSSSRAVLIVVGKPIVTVSFFCNQTSNSSIVTESSVNTAIDLHQIVKSWTPDAILPNLYLKPRAPPVARQKKETVPLQMQASGEAEEPKKRKKSAAAPVSVAPKKKTLKIPEPPKDEEGNYILPQTLKPQKTAQKNPKKKHVKMVYDPESL
jgi:dCTP deaminase-like protein